MNDKLVTHEDLALIEDIEAAYGESGPGAALLARLRAAAEADRPPLPEPMHRGAVVVGEGGIEWVRVHPGGDAWVNGYGRWAAWEEIGARSVKSPRPTVTEADVEKAADLIGTAWPRQTSEDVARDIFRELGIEVQP